MAACALQFRWLWLHKMAIDVTGAQIVLIHSVRNCPTILHCKEEHPLETGILCAGGEEEGIHAEAHEHNRRRGEMVSRSWNPHECLPGGLLLNAPCFAGHIGCHIASNV